MKKRYDCIDYAKGIGILLVVLGHMQLLDCRESIQPLTNVIYSFHMPLFFFVTGLTLNRKYSAGKPEMTDLKKLARRLMIPYFAWSGVYILLKCASAGEGFARIIKRNLAATLTLRGIAPLWFLSALFIAEVLVILLVYELHMNKLLLLALTGTLTVSLGNAVQVFNGVFGFYARLPIITFYRIFPCIFFITLGCIMSELFVSDKRLSIGQNAFLTLSSAALFSAVNILSPGNANLYKMSFDSPAAFVLAGTAGSIMVVSLCSLLPKNIIPLTYLGKNSMLIMILHYPPIPIILLNEQLAVSLGLDGYSCAAFAAAFTAIIAAAFCLLYQSGCDISAKLIGKSFKKNITAAETQANV